MAEGPGKSPPLPYARHSLDAADARAVLAALGAERIAQGPEMVLFEEALAKQVGTQAAVAVSSGTAALEVALGALGVGPGDEVVVPSLTFLATCNAVLARGARPVFADVDPETLTLDPVSVAERVGERTRGAIPMHFAGHPADMLRLRLALGPDRFLLEDAAHALGATLGGRPAGSLGDAGCFSFHPAKLVTTGEGGAVTTDWPELAERLRSLREHGVVRDPARFRGLGLPEEHAAEERGDWVYEQHERGSNFRLSELGAALGRSQLARADAFLERRREIANRYACALAELDTLELPHERRGARSAWHLFPIRLRTERLRLRRAELHAALHERGIEAQVHYIPVHLQPFYRTTLGSGWGDLPRSEAAYLRLLSLPLFPALTDAEVDRVAATLRGILEGARR